MKWGASDTDTKTFDRDCAVLEKHFSAAKSSDRALCDAFRVVATVITRLTGKQKMAALVREICADLDLVCAAPVARRRKEQGSAARRSAKMFRAAFDLVISLVPSSVPRTLRHWHGRARRCVPNFRIFHPK
jgi:hypothetical protein